MFGRTENVEGCKTGHHRFKGNIGEESKVCRKGRQKRGKESESTGFGWESGEELVTCKKWQERSCS